MSRRSVTALSRDGSIRLFGNRYWSDECSRLAGLPETQRKVWIEYDPDDLSGIHVEWGYEHWSAGKQNAGGFNDSRAAKEHAASRRRAVNAIKTAGKLAAKMDADTFEKLLRESMEADRKAAEAAAADAMAHREDDVILGPWAVTHDDGGATDASVELDVLIEQSEVGEFERLQAALDERDRLAG